MTTADGRPIRLFDLFRGPHWTLLTFGGRPAMDGRFGPAHPVVRPGEPAGAHAVVDVDGHVRTAYGATDDMLVLVRPDGHLGLVTTLDRGERVAEYWTALHGPRPAYGRAS